jgi:peptidoglycan/xylan/chitin deacetylase (PgdA/CDA1 family)
VLAAIESAGYRHVGWHVAPDDWDPDHSAAFVTDAVLRGVESHGDGAVVLLHTWPSATLAAIDPILDGLAGAGLELCRIDELETIPADVA